MLDRGSDQFSVNLMGGFLVRSGAVVLPLRPTTQRLAAFLALKGPRSRENLTAALWPDRRPDIGRRDLRTILWRSRASAPGLFVEEGSTLRLMAEECDAHEVKRWAVTILEHRTIERFPEGLAEELLPGWDEEWLAEEREELRLLQLQALDSAAQQLLSSGQLAQAARTAMTATRIDPLRESATRLLIEIHLRQGNELEAVRRFQRYESLLRRELGVYPGPALRTLIAPVLNGVVVPPAGEMPR